MLSLVVGAAALNLQSAVLPNGAVRAPAASMILGFGKTKTAEDTVGKVVPTNLAGASPEEVSAALMNRLAFLEDSLEDMKSKTEISGSPVQKYMLVPLPADAAPVTKEEVLEVQKKWAGAIKSISKTYLEKGDYIAAAADAAAELYAYGHSNVLFKPTKAAEFQFRPTGEDAMSYFVGGDAVEGGYKEDGGFAINGGKGWSECIYDNHQIELKGGIGIAMGNYYFTCATTGDKAKVEYTFGYMRCADGKVRIFLHHSSVPYSA